jgi:SSS family solute:Na+ symporter
VAALFAASMSSFDSAINALNNTALVDLLGRKGNDPNGLKIARLMSIPWGVLALVAALCAAAAGTGLLYQALYFTSLFTGPLLAMMTMAFYCSHWHSRSVIGGVIIGITGLFLCSPPAFLDWYPPVASWPYNPLISCAGTWLGAALVENIARHFLPTTRPS